MSDQMQPNDAEQDIIQGKIYYDEPQTKPPPLLEVGVLAWMRQNLFGSVLDTILTFLGIALIISVVSSFVLWSVRAANWFVIMFNLRSFMIGRFEIQHEWRVQVFVVAVAVVTGFALAAWVRRLSPLVIGTVILIVALVVGLPLIINATVPLPETYLTAGNVGIISGSEELLPDSQLSFIAEAGETVSIRMAEQFAANDEDLAQLYSFTDRAANNLRNTAINRLELIEREAFLMESLEEGALITNNQRENFTEELEDLEIPEPTVDIYQLNQDAITIRVLSFNESEEAWTPLSDEPHVLEPENGQVDITLPNDGWYILEKTMPEDSESIALLEINGIYPILERTFFQEGETDEAGEATTASGFANQYIRMTDRFTVNEPRPTIDDEEIPFAVIIDTQYRGERSFGDYLRVFLGQFLNQISLATIILFVAAVAGYFVAKFGDRATSPPENPRKFSTTVATWGLIISPLLMFLAIRGLTIQELLFFCMLGSWFLVVILLRDIGTWLALNMNLHTKATAQKFITSLIILIPVFALVAFGPMLLAGGDYATGTNEYGLGALIAIFGFFALWQGIHEPNPQAVDTRRRLTMYGAAVAGLYLIPVALVFSGLFMTADGTLAQGPLAVTDARRWGGLLLTMFLTVFGIILSFPLGLLLALGRRSSLPAVKYICTLYIELVRGSPLITVLFLMQLMIPLVNPAFAEIDSAIRALIAVFMFSAAYLAENVRGGLQSIPPGQEEASKAVGLSNWQTIRFITMPQALRAVIPALVGQFISLFKDTSLVAIVGLIDLTGFVNVVVVQAEFIGLRREALLFITILYFVFSYVMSYVSRRIEETGSGAARRI